LKRERISRICKDGKYGTDEYLNATKLSDELQELFSGTQLQKKDQRQAYLDEIIDRSNRKPVHTGIKKLDKMLGGLRQGELTTISARPSVGKSAFCLQIAESAAEQKKKVLFFTLEMSEYELGDRNVQKWSTIDGYKLRQGFDSFDEKEAKEFFMIHDTKVKNFYEYVTVETSIAQIDLFASIIDNEKPDLVIIDQLSCLRTSKAMQIRERFCYCTTLLKRLAVEKNIPILLAAQVSRSADGRKPTLADLKESGSIEEDSDNCIILWRTDENEQGENRSIACELAKHRQGETGGVALVYSGKKLKFYELTQ
jgi:replicative DNA helicase